MQLDADGKSSSHPSGLGFGLTLEAEVMLDLDGSQMIASEGRTELRGCEITVYVLSLRS